MILSRKIVSNSCEILLDLNIILPETFEAQRKTFYFEVAQKLNS